LEAIFGAIDEEGDGQITEERLVEALERPLVPR
jgi:Ca2+-binding EF-hand superfamily protein